MWGTGAATVLNGSKFVGAEWNNETASLGKIVGKVSTVSVNTNPAWWVWKACKETVNVLCGSQPSKGTVKTNVDTRTGAKLDVTTSGKLGLEFGYTVNSGSVDANLDFSATALLPDGPVKRGEFFNLNADAVLSAGTITSQSPEVEAYINAIAKLSGSVSAQACLILSGCATGSFNLPTVNEVQHIISADPNNINILKGILPNDEPLAKVALANQTFTLKGALDASLTPGFKVTSSQFTLADTTPPTPDLEVDLASVEVIAPNIATSGGKDGEVLKSGGRSDFLRGRVDIDGVAAMSGVIPPLGIGVSLIDAFAGKLKVGAQIDLLDVDAGPDIGITQDFELTPTLMVRLDFGAPVMVQGLAGLHTFWEGAWENLPGIALALNSSRDVSVTPTFWLDATLSNMLGIDLGLTGTFDILKLGATARVGGVDLLQSGSLSLNSLLGFSNQLFSTPKVRLPVWDSPFQLGGFQRTAGAQFVLQAVPAPATLSLMLLGLLATGAFRRRARLRQGNK